MLYPIIMAGGAGTRLWPISRQGQPKQVYPLLDQETLLQKTWKRLLASPSSRRSGRRGFPARRILVSTHESLSEEVKKQLVGRGFIPRRGLGQAPALQRWWQENLVTEPARRGTAPALALALLKLVKLDPRATFVYINADNYIAKEAEFLRLLRVAERAVNKKPDQVVLIGVNPTYPESGLGYIKMGSSVLKFGRDEIFQVERFVEKPDLPTAKAFLKSWRYLWNPTLIVSRVDHFLALYQKHLPKMWKHLAVIERVLGSAQESAVLACEFPKITAETIDYGILEREKNMLVLPGNFGWTDVGSWRAVHEILAKNKEQRAKSKNICRAGKCVSVDSRGNLVYSLSGKLVALAGVKDMILIESEKALLLCPKSQVQAVKKLVENLEKKGLKEYL